MSGSEDLLVSSGGVLQLVEQGRGAPGVLRHQGADHGDAQGKLLEFVGLPPAHGSGDGVCHTCRSRDEAVLRRDGGVAGEVWLVLEEQQGAAGRWGARSPTTWGCSTSTAMCMPGARIDSRATIRPQRTVRE